MLTASIGLGVMAASFTPQAQPEPTPEPTAVVEATPTPEPTATPEPDKDLYVDVTVVQQDIGVELYTLPTTTPESAAETKDEDAEETAAGDDFLRQVNPDSLKVVHGYGEP